ncbi:MAG: hypothetical protein ABIJ15_05205 [bacterium]
MIFAGISLVLIVVFVFWLGLNPLIGVLVGLQMALGLNRKAILKEKFRKWLFHIVFVITTLSLIFLLAEYVSGEIVAVSALWAISSAVFSYRESRWVIRSNSSPEKK